MTILVITTVNFFLFQVLPGDPTRIVAIRGGGCTGNSSLGNQQCGLRAELIIQWGLDKPVAQRYIIYMSNLLQGNLGIVFTTPGLRGLPVTQVVAPALATTLELIGLATIVTMWLGLVLGRISGWRRGTRTDVIITMSTLVGYSMPSFWVSLFLVFGFAYLIRLFPIVQPQPGPDVLVNIANQLWDWVLPISAFVITNIAWFSLTLRNSLTDVLPEDYMVTAAAKGLNEQQQLRWHALPNARLPVVTASALYFGWVVSGTIVIETVFGIRGLGYLTWEATLNQDLPLMQAIFLIATIGVVVANAIADVLYMYLDPRVREA